MFNKILPHVLVGLLLAAIGGLIDMRIALTRVEAKQDAAEARLERIERHIDSDPRMGYLGTP